MRNVWIEDEFATAVWFGWCVVWSGRLGSAHPLGLSQLNAARGRSAGRNRSTDESAKTYVDADRWLTGIADPAKNPS
jgi:hypothetical protein